MTASAISPYESFSVATVPDRAEVAVVPVGELDLATSPELDGEIRRLRDVGFDRIVVDLRRVEFLDSTALGTLLALCNDAKRDGHRLIFVPGATHVQRVFELTGTLAVFDWRDY